MKIKLMLFAILLFCVDLCGQDLLYIKDGQCIETEDQITGEKIYYWSGKNNYNAFMCYGEWTEWQENHMIKIVKHEAKSIKYTVDIMVSDSLFNFYNAEFCKMMDSVYYKWLTEKQKLFLSDREKYEKAELKKKKQALINEIEQKKKELEKLK